MSHRGMIEEINYANDPRVRAANRESWYESIDLRRMVAKVWIGWGEDEDQELVECPLRMEVCDMCSGSGRVVNPSIDSNGLSAEDFAEDPDFREEYFRGSYDVSCPECHGRNVVPRPDLESPDGKRVSDWLREMAEAEHASHLERMAEMRMGA